MKIALGMRPYDGPWGGGNRFAASLSEGIAAAGHTVVHTLDDADIDVIVLVDPRTRAPNVTFGAGAIMRYLALRNPAAIVVHRINECDERKGTPFINAKLARANYVADWTVFVGSWLAGLPVWRKNLHTPWRTIRNGADKNLFNADGFVPWSGDGPLKLVTHHWGYHPMKGFDVYAAIDARLADPAFAARYSFTYIGNLPANFRFAHARHVAPLNGRPLVDTLCGHHAYVTASINEPGGNHQNEGAACGLPLLYRASGCMPEYCDGFGIAFEGPQDFEAGLEQLRGRYGDLARAMAGYPNTAAAMVRGWLALFAELNATKDAIRRDRALWRRPLAAARCFLSL
jgi:hypothetical protein